MDKNTALTLAIQILQGQLDGPPSPSYLSTLSGFFTQAYPTVPVVTHATYPAYVPPVSDAYQNAAGGHQLINTNLLSTAAQAVQLSIDLGGAGISIVNDPNVVYGDSGRKQFLLTVPGHALPINVGLALQDQNRAGVGAPGSWDLSTGATNLWKLTDSSLYPW